MPKTSAEDNRPEGSGAEATEKKAKAWRVSQGDEWIKNPSPAQRLWAAVARGDEAETMAIALAEPETARAANALGESALMQAIQKKQERLALALLPLSDAKKNRFNGASPLSEAAHHGLAELARALAPLSEADAVNGGGMTALMRAANHDSAECVRALLPFCDAKKQGVDGWSALLIAARYGRMACVEALLPESDLEARALINELWRDAAELARASRHEEVALAIERFKTSQLEKEALSQSLRESAASSRRSAL